MGGRRQSPVFRGQSTALGLMSGTLELANEVSRGRDLMNRNPHLALPPRDPSDEVYRKSKSASREGAVVQS